VNSELGLAEIAAELGIDEAALELRIANNDQLKNLGMTPLVSGGVLKRDDWQKTTAGNSNFQQACRFLKLGVPLTVLKNQ
jgi:hypothetical protein